MKKLLTAIILASVAVTGFAQHRPGFHHHYGGGGWAWVAPAVIGGAVVYGLTRPSPPPVVVQQPPVVVNQQPTVVYIDGIAYTKQWMQINGQWQEVLVRI
jgi:hypothetical protein